MRRNILRLAASLGVSLLVLGLIFKLGSDDTGEISRTRILDVFRSASMALIVVGCGGCTLAQTVLRAARYRLLLPASGGRKRPAFLPVLLVTATRNMFVDLLPARAGELSYVVALNQACGVPAHAGFSSMALSLFLDFSALLALVLGIAGISVARGLMPPWMAPALAAVTAATVIFGVFIFIGIKACARLAERMFPRLAAMPLIRKLLDFALGLAGAIRETPAGRVMLPAFLLSLGVRCFKYAGFYLAFLGVTRAGMPELASAPMPGVILALLGAEAAAGLPIPAFMSFGTYELGGTLALCALGFSAEQSRITMLVVHIYSQVIDYLLGGIGLASLFWLRSARPAAPAAAGAPARRRARMAALGGLLALAIGGGVFAFQMRAASKIGRLAPPASGADQAPAATELDGLRRAAAPLKGRLFWSSNRFGNHEILSLSLPGLELQRLTTNSNVDYYARVSPDGKLLAFCRSQLEWVSFRDTVAWDLVLLDLAGGTERVLAQNAHAPAWTSDGRAICYQRNGDEAMLYDLETGEHRSLFKSGKGPVPANVRLDTPGFRPGTGELVATLRGKQRRTTLFSASGETKIGGGCETAWAPQYDFIYYVLGSRKGVKNLFMKYFPDRKESEQWLDIPGPWNHAYFPKLSWDATHLVYGASTGGHEQDSADYEIFLWKVGTAPAEAARVTFHTGNDNWPDLFLEPPAQ